MKWNDANKIILERVKELAFPIKSTTLKYIHILDLQKEGFIRPHVDAVRVSNRNLIQSGFQKVFSSSHLLFKIIYYN